MRKPHLRLVIINKCNLACVYCRAGGEGVICNDIMSKDEIVLALRLAAKAGYSYLKITGGEPLLREEICHDLFDIISQISREKMFAGIGLVTNGVLLKKYADEILSSGLDSLTVSLDTADEQEYQNITGRNCFEEVVEGVSILKNRGMKININAVVSNINIDGVPALIKLAEDLGVDLKLIDYVDFFDEQDNSADNKKIEYVSFDTIYRYMESQCVKKRIELPYGGLGTPMTVYSISEKCEVYIKDATVGTNYNEQCKQCRNYPCQDALISMRITADGQLKKCLLRDDNLVPFLEDIRNGNINLAECKFDKSWKELMSAEYYPGMWSASL